MYGFLDDHFPITISIIPNNLAGTNLYTPNIPSHSLHFNLHKANLNLFSDVINQNITSIDYTFCPIKAYNQFSHIIIEAAKQSIKPKQ